VKLKNVIVGVLAVLMTTTSISASQLPSFMANDMGVDYANATVDVMGFGTNSYNTNHVSGSAVFPLVPGFVPVEVGLSDCQPVVVDDFILVMGGNKISVLDRNEGKVHTTYTIDGRYPLFKRGSLFVHKIAEDEYVVVGAAGNMVMALDMKVEREVPVDEGVGLVKLVEINEKWYHESNMEHYKLATQAVTLLQDALGSKQYYGFSNASGMLTVLDAQTGKASSGDRFIKKGGLYGGSPAVLPAGNGKFSTLLISGKDYLLSSNIFSGIVSRDSVLNENTSVNLSGVGDMQNPVTLAYIKVGGAPTPVALMQTREGVLIGYRVGGGSKIPLFKIDQFARPGIGFNGLSVKGKYGVVSQGDGNLFVIDLERAVNEGASDVDKLANDAVVFNKKMGSALGAAPISLTVATESEIAGETQQKISREVMIIATKEGKVGMYYIDQYDALTKSPIEVPNAFNIDGVIKSSINIEKGIASQVTYGGGSLVFIDGAGYLHCYSAKPSKNLALSNLTNSSMTLQKGSTYEAAVDVVNFTGKDLKDVDIQFFMNGEEVHRSKVDVKASGVTVYLSYTLPSDFSKKTLAMSAQVNMIPTSRVIEEEVYEDNVASLMLDVAEDVDLAVTNIEFNEYPANQKVSSLVTVKNFSKTTDVENVPVEFKITVAGQSATSTRYVSLMAGHEMTLVFSFNTPNQNTTANLFAEINRTNVYEEENKGNNTRSLVATIYKDDVGGSCAETARWSETISRRKTGKNDDGTTYRYTQYYTYRYEARIHATATLTPTVLKAGYGFEVDINSHVTYRQTNRLSDPRTPSNRPTSPSLAKVTTRFGKGIYMLQRVSSSGSSASFKMYEDPTSSIRARKIYTPRELAGTMANPVVYPIAIEVYGSSVAGKDLCITVNKTITINGDMYEDDNTY